MEVVEFCAELEQHFGDSDANAFVFEHVLGLIHPSKAVEQSCLVGSVDVVNFSAVLGEDFDDLEVASHAGRAEGCKAVVVRRHVNVN